MANMWKCSDQTAIGFHVQSILEILTKDTVLREGLLETPLRVSKMLLDVFEGMQYTNDEIVQMYNKTFEDGASEDLVVVKDIDIFSYCEHHMALMYDMKVSVGYLPNGSIIGLSKVARVAEMVGKRLQVQERIGTDILEIIQKICNTENVIVSIKGKHSCMTARGIKKPNSETVTTALAGLFKTNSELRKEFYDILRR